MFRPVDGRKWSELCPDQAVLGLPYLHGSSVRPFLGRVILYLQAFRSLSFLFDPEVRYPLQAKIGYHLSR